jgi:DeoR family transcriptional regulator of aga operon
MSGTLPAVRRERMLTLIRDREFARVAELSERFNVSTVTVRADLDYLERRGSVQRVHGGAVLAPGGDRLELPFEEAATSAAEEKTAIGRTAADMVHSGDVVIVDVGTTTSAVARSLVARRDLDRVVIVTNGLNIAMVFEAAAPRFTVVVTGGTVRPLQHSLVDPFGGPVLERINADLMFLGCNGVDVRTGVTNVNLPEAEMKQRMMRSARRTVAVADGSKVGETSVAWVCGIAELDSLVTGESATLASVAELEEEGLKVRVAS